MLSVGSSDFATGVPALAVIHDPTAAATAAAAAAPPSPATAPAAPRAAAGTAARGTNCAARSGQQGSVQSGGVPVLGTFPAVGFFTAFLAFFKKFPLRIFVQFR